MKKKPILPEALQKFMDIKFLGEPTFFFEGAAAYKVYKYEDKYYTIDDEDYSVEEVTQQETDG